MSRARMNCKVSVLHGDGIGPQMIEAALAVLEAATEETLISFEWVGCSTPEEFAASLALTAVGLKGPLDARLWHRPLSPNQWLRRALDLSVNVRPARSFGATDPDVDMLTIHHTRPGHISPSEYRNFLYSALEYAEKHGRRRVTVTYKPQFFPEDTTLVEQTHEIAPLFAGLAIDYLLADTAAMRMAQNPACFDVLICNAVYGDLFSDLAAGFIGGRGFAPGANYSPVQEYAVFEALHGSAEKLVGTKRANPIAAILSGALLLRHLGEGDAAIDVEHSCACLMRTGVAGLSTSEITRAVIYGLRSRVPG